MSEVLVPVAVWFREIADTSALTVLLVLAWKVADYYLLHLLDVLWGHTSQHLLAVAAAADEHSLFHSMTPALPKVGLVS